MVLSSCNKDKNISGRLSGEIWDVKSISVAGVTNNDLPELTFDDCKIYKESCTANWSLDNVEADFIWQFRDNGNTFEISNQSKVTEDLESSIIQCMNLSGIYDVTESSKTTLSITSSATIGYEGESVVIEMEKQ